ncbi:kinase-like protein [Sistotremastrum niveocremeum HHB9708]|uniref:Kinase-like protein n=1 Tax=Sistotremastrum niveocremeum HHB9708 TaxID=1314777 RepID=A0A164R2D3_9AGAM|nr:kinase-like protein [Sistotremastrum niveocremeum HHB9708]
MISTSTSTSPFVSPLSSSIALSPQTRPASLPAPSSLSSASASLVQRHSLAGSMQRFKRAVFPLAISHTHSHGHLEEIEEPDFGTPLDRSLDEIDPSIPTTITTTPRRVRARANTATGIIREDKEEDYEESKRDLILRDDAIGTENIAYVLKRAELHHINTPKKLQTGYISVLLESRQFSLPKWVTMWAVLTANTLSLHKNETSPSKDLIFLKDISHVERFHIRPYCLRLTAGVRGRITLSFDNGSDLFNWWDVLHDNSSHSKISRPTNFQHVIKVHHDPDTGRLEGLPDEWAAVLEFDEKGQRQRARSFSNPEVIDISRRNVSRTPLGPRPMRRPSVDSSGSTTRHAHAHMRSDGSSARKISGDRVSLFSQTGRRPYLERELYKPRSSPPPPPSEMDNSPYSYDDQDPRNYTDRVRERTSSPLYQTELFDVWHADLGNRHVSIKAFRSDHLDPKQVLKVKTRLEHELKILHQLSFKNCVKTYGVTTDLGEIPALVTPRQANGNVVAYLRRLGPSCPVSRKIRILCEVAAGLNFLFAVHSYATPVIHGNLTGSTILINQDGEATLSDFGLPSLIDAAPSLYVQKNFRWLAPEILQSEKVFSEVMSEATDAYSFGSVMLEILTGFKPYSNMEDDIECLRAILQGVKPRRPVIAEVNPPVWDFMERCWGEQQCYRPSMALGLLRMEEFLEDAEYWEKSQSTSPTSLTSLTRSR